MKKKCISILFLLICFNFSYAQNTHISVTGYNLGGKNVRLSVIDDRVSLLEKNLKDIVLDSSEESINFDITIEGVKEMCLKVNIREYHFLASAGRTYNINILQYDDSTYRFDYKDVLPVEIVSTKYDNLNSPIYAIDTALDEFLRDNNRLLFLKDSACMSNFNGLQQRLSEKCRGDEYLEDYILYEFASVKYGLGLESKRLIKDSLFATKPILYDNIGYMDCLNTVFGKYFSKGYKYIKRSDLESWINEGSYSHLNDALGRDKVLENEVFREIVFLIGMKDAYLDGYFSRKHILDMLEDFSTRTKFVQHKTIAQNLIVYLKDKDLGGKESRDFLLKNIKGEKVSMHQYFSKPLLICLVRLDNKASLQELYTLNYYYDSIKSSCNVVAISFDDRFETMYNFVKNSSVGSMYKWDFLYFDGDWEMVDYFHLHFFPTFVLINKDGTIKQNPFPFPSAGGLETITKE